MFVKIAALSCVLLLASACVTSGYKSIGYDREGASYNTSRMNFTLTGDDRGTCHVPVKSRPYEQNGKTHICGYIHDPEQGGCGGLGLMSEDLIHAWFSGAKLILGGTVISSASFLDFRTRTSRIPCVATEVDWRLEFQYDTARFKGDFTSRQY